MHTNTDRAHRWYRDVWAPGGEATVLELMAENVHGQMEGADIHGRDQFLAQREIFLTAFSDLRIVADDVIAEGEKVAVRWRVTATHTGDALGFAASHRQVAFRGITWLEFEHGRIVRGWDSWNLGHLLHSLQAL